MTSKKRLDTGPSKVDDDFALGGFDDDFGFESPKDSRKPANPIRRGVADAVKGHLTDPRQLRNYVGKALPSQYGDLADDYTNAREQVTQAVDDVRSQAQAPINALARNLRDKVPKRFERMHKVINRIEKSTNSNQYNWAADSPEKVRNDEVRDVVSDVFAAFEERQQQDAENKEAVEEDRFAREYMKSQAQLELTGKMARAADYQMNFTKGVLLPYMKKSIELKYRTAAGISDLVKITTALAQQQKAQLDAVVINTKLPDIQKLRMTENYKQSIRNKFIDKTLGTFGGEGGPLNKMLQNLTNNIRDTAMMAMSGVDMANMGMEMSGGDGFEEDNSPDAIKRRRAKQIAGLVGQMGPAAAGRLSRAQMRKNPKLTKAVFSGARKIGNFRNNMHSKLREYANGDMLGADSVLRDLVGMMLPDRDNNSEAGMVRGERLKEATSFDFLTRRSITEVIPGYLARILQELQITRTGKPADIMSYNYDKGRFEGSSARVKELNARTNLSSTTSSESLDRVMKDIERSGVTLTDDQRQDLTRAILHGRKSGRTMTNGTLSREGFYKNTTSPEKAPELAAIMRKYLHTGTDGKYTDTRKGERASNRLFNEMSIVDSDSHNIRAMIQDLFDSGQGELAYQAGWMTNDGQIDVKRVMDAMGGIDKGKGPVGYSGAPGGFSPSSPAPKTINPAITSPYGATTFRMPDVTAAAMRSRTETSLLEQSEKLDESRAIVEAIQAFQGTAGEKLDSIIELMSRRSQEMRAGHANGEPGMPGEGGSFSDRLSGAASRLRESMMGRFGRVAPSAPDAEAGEGDEAEAGMPGFWKRNIREHGVAALGFGRRMLNRAGRLENRARAKVFGEGVGYGKGISNAAEKSRLVGARYFKDFKDGLPEIGDVYIDGIKNAVIKGYDLSSGRLKDATGKVIYTLSDLASSTGDIFDEMGATVISREDLKKSYVKAKGEIIRDVWTNRVMKFAKKVLAGLGAAAAGAFQTGRLVNAGARKAFVIARNLLAPPYDVYVKGEEEARLFAYLMKAGGYFNQVDGSPIERPVNIKGPVVDKDGNVVLSHEDFVKGLVNAQGEPVRTIFQKIVLNAKKNILATGKIASAVGKKLLSGVRTAGRLGGAFLSRGLTGVLSGSWKNGAGASGGEAGSSPLAGDQSVMLLAEIRDILRYNTYPSSANGGKGKGKGIIGGVVDAAKEAAEERQRNINDPTRSLDDVETPSSHGGGNVIGSLAGAATGMVKGAWNMGKAFLARRRGRRGLGIDGGGGTEPAEESTKSETKQEAREEKRDSRLKKMFDALKKKKETPDTSNLRKGSYEERVANYKNINAPTKTLDDVKMPEKTDRKNVFDLIAGAVKTGLSGLSGLGESLSDLLGGDGEGRKKRGKGRGRAGKAGRAAGKRGLLSRAGSAIWNTGKAIVKAPFGQVGGTAGRAATAAKWGSRAMAAGRFMGKRVLMPALAGVATVLGAPVVGTALTAAGVVWGLKSVYDMLQPDKPLDTTAKLMETIRILEYGFSPNDNSAVGKLLQVESMLTDSVKTGQGGQLQINKDTLDVEPLLTIFGVSMDNKKHVQAFLDWFDGRFKPTFLKWLTVAKAIGKGMASLEDMDTTQRKKALDATAANTGWDIVDNPFGGSKLVVTSDQVKEARTAAASMLTKKGEKAKADGVPETLTRKDAMKMMTDDLKKVTDGKTSFADATRNVDNLGEALKRGENSRKMEAFTSQALDRVDRGALSAMQSIRIRLYGYTDIGMGVVSAIRGTEKAFVDKINVDSNGVGNFSGDMTQAYQDCCKYFGLSGSDAASELRWQTWVKERFLPVYVTFVGQLQFRTGSKEEIGIERKVDSLGLWEIAQAVGGLNVWKNTVMPVPGQQANTDSSTIKPFMDALRDAADKQKARETTKAAPVTQNAIDQSKMNSQQLGGTSGVDDLGMQRVKANAMFAPQPVNVMPDVEKEPKSSGGSSSGGASQSSAPVPSNLAKAPGELASGSGGMKWIKAPSASHIDGLNPEVKRLFLAMAEEYGNETQQRIQVNRGFVSYDEQKKEYQQNPQKAAPPGSSNHEFGLALDVNTVDLNRMEKMGLLRKYGFTRPVGGETWHLEPAGIQGNFREVRKDQAAASQAVKDGIGQGGGGVGATKAGFRFGGRDTAHAMKIRGSSDSAPSGGEAGKATEGATAINVNAAMGSPGSATAAPSSGGGSSGGGGAASQGVTSAGGGAPSATAEPGSFASSTAGGSGASMPTNNAYASLPKGSSREEMKDLITKAAGIVGVDKRDALMTAAMESSFKPDANSGQASGLMQFTKGTWGDVMRKHAAEYGIPSGTSPTDPRAAALLGVRYLKDNQAGNNSGLSPIEVGYLKYFLGPSGGKKALALSGNAIMAEAFPSFAEKNKPTFYNKDGSARTKDQFMQAIRERMTKTANDFGIPVPDMGGASSSGGISQVAGVKAMSKPSDAPAYTPPAPSRSAATAPSGGSAGGEYFSNDNRSTGTGQPTVAPRSSAEQALLKAMGDSNTIADQSLNVLKDILATTEKLVNVIADASKAPASTSAPQANQPPASRERDVRQVGNPSYRVA